MLWFGKVLVVLLVICLRIGQLATLNEECDTIASKQIPGFNTAIFRTGPIVIKHRNRILLTNVHYDGQEDLIFYVEDNPTTTTTFLLRSDESLPNYGGQNVHVDLPEDLTNRKFGVWSRSSNSSIASVLFHDEEFEEGPVIPQRLLYLPKCCGLNQIIFPMGICQTVNDTCFNPTILVLENNETHVNDEPLDSSLYKFVPYVTKNSCVKIYFNYTNEKDGYLRLLSNTSLLAYTSIAKEVLNHDNFCFDNTNASKGETLLFKCIFETNKTEDKKAIIFFTLAIISTISYAITAVWYWFVLQVKDDHKRSFVAYSVSMFFTFLFLSLLQNLSSQCTILGGFFIFFTMLSYCWLLVLAFDLYIIVAEKSDKSRNKLLIYFVFTVIFSSLVTAIIMYDGNADVPNSFIKRNYNKCSFSNTNGNLFFLPMLFLVLLSAVCLILIKIKIKQSCILRKADYFWIENARNYKFMFRSYFVFWIMMSLWLIEAIVLMNVMNSPMIYTLDLIEAMQGAMTLIIFLFTKYGMRETLKVFKDKKMKKESRAILESKLNATSNLLIGNTDL